MTNSNNPKALKAPALVSRLEQLRAEAKAKPPMGQSESLWRAIEMIDLVFQLGTITVGSVIQLQGITHRLAQGQETILDKLGGLGQNVEQLKLEAGEIKDEIAKLKKKVDELADSIAITNNMLQDHINPPDSLGLSS